MMDEVKYFDINFNEKYVETEYIKELTSRALTYTDIGFPVHLRGSSGVGKTALAFHIAKKIGRPIVFMCGSEEFSSFDLIGGYFGSKQSIVVDNYISSVYKREEQLKKMWTDGRLVTACKEGYTVIYDEFTRAKPEINNVLLSVLEEQMVDIPNYSSENTYIKIHPDFKIIFTSNPEEYVGVYKSANALIDRMVTIDINDMDFETEKIILMSKSGVNERDAQIITKITRYIRSNTNNKMWLSIRCSVMLAKITKKLNLKITASNEMFKKVCKDVYNSPSVALGMNDIEKEKYFKLIDKAIYSVFEPK
jgi:nitric oxide reductase NorQ protein